MAIKPVTFSPGNPITADDLNTLQSNIQSIYDDTVNLTNTTTGLDGTIKKIFNRIGSDLIIVGGLSKDKIVTNEFVLDSANFTKKPFMTVSIAEDLKEKEDVDLSIYALNATRFKVSVKTNDPNRKEIKLNYIAVSTEETTS